MWSSSTTDPLIQELWVREVFFTRLGLTYEAATRVFSTQQIADALTYWRIEGEVRHAQANAPSTSGQRDATEAAYQRARAARRGAP